MIEIVMYCTHPQCATQHKPFVPFLASSKVMDGLAGTSSKSVENGAGLVNAGYGGQ